MFCIGKKLDYIEKEDKIDNILKLFEKLPTEESKQKVLDKITSLVMEYELSEKVEK
jgi:hypothetical protein